MILRKLIAMFFFFLVTMLFAETKEVNKLFEKVDQAPNSEIKKELIEELKIKLAEKNIKAREEADAIIKAKKKLPLKIYKDESIRK